MTKLSSIIAAAAVSLAALGAAHGQQQSGMVGSAPPEDIFLEVTYGEAGVSLSQQEFKLALGGYYRFNLVCPAAGVENEAGISFETPDLWQNSHLRIISVSDPTSTFQQVPEINFHLQGLQIRAIDCEGLGAAARVSFFPMRRGTYAFSVLDDTVEPPARTEGRFVVE